jgi:hypothetical protein
VFPTVPDRLGYQPALIELNVSTPTVWPPLVTRLLHTAKLSVTVTLADAAQALAREVRVLNAMRDIMRGTPKGMRAKQQRRETLTVKLLNWSRHAGKQ